MKNKVFKQYRLPQEGWLKKKFWLIFIAILLLTFNTGYAASYAPMFSLTNTDFVVAIAFFIFLGVLIYFKVPRIIANLLDKRADNIRSEIDEAHKLLEDAKSLLAKLEREHKENINKAQEIIEDAVLNSKKMIEDSKSEIKNAVSRKIQLAERQIETNEKEILKSIKDDLIDVAFQLAQKEIEKKIDLKLANLITKGSITEIESRLS